MITALCKRRLKKDSEVGVTSRDPESVPRKSSVTLPRKRPGSPPCRRGRVECSRRCVTIYQLLCCWVSLRGTELDWRAFILADLGQPPSRRHSPINVMHIALCSSYSFSQKLGLLVFHRGGRQKSGHLGFIVEKWCDFNHALLPIFVALEEQSRHLETKADDHGEPIRGWGRELLKLVVHPVARFAETALFISNVYRI